MLESISRIAPCHTLPEVLDVEAKWLQRAFEDDSEEASRLIEFNPELAACFFPVLSDAQPGLPDESTDRSGWVKFQYLMTE